MRNKYKFQGGKTILIGQTHYNLDVSLMRKTNVLKTSWNHQHHK